MFSDEGGVGTMSSSVRRARSSCGRFAGVVGVAGARDAVARAAGALRRAFLTAFFPAFFPAVFFPTAFFPTFFFAAFLRAPACLRVEPVALRAARRGVDRRPAAPTFELRLAFRPVRPFALAMNAHPFGTLTVWR
jgi:hypothetical protein